MKNNFCFSVVIPTYNRLPILRKCLQALEKQKYEAEIVNDYEVIVVDDGSTDG
ncbi:MAG: glycosyltransferase family 2 protein, partial [Cyanobacteria bacterium J083]